MKPASRESERFCQGEKSDEDLGGAELNMLIFRLESFILGAREFFFIRSSLFGQCDGRAFKLKKFCFC